MYGKYYEQKPGAPLEILFHGYHGAAERDFCGGFWLAREAGHNVILVDERGHGKSEGRVLSFGIKEQYDCLEWTKYATERFGEDTKIVLGGISMGASIVLLAAGLDLPNTVKGILADCGYTSPKEIVQKVSGDRGLPVKIMYPRQGWGRSCLDILIWKTEIQRKRFENVRFRYCLSMARMIVWYHAR